MNLLRTVIVFVCAYIVLSTVNGCGEVSMPESRNDVIEAPPGFPVIPYPSDNVPSESAVELGRRLFYDTRLSNDGKTACSSCHIQSHGFADTSMVSIGHAGENGSRNAQSIVNVAYYTRWFWDGRAATLEDQIQTALLSRAEMHADTIALCQRLSADALYRERFMQCFGDSTLISTRAVVKALATFCRSLVSGRSRFDRYILGEKTALSEPEQRGMRLFYSDRTNCSRCHSGFNFSDNQFHSIALHAHYYDRGLWYQTHREEDIGKFRTPSLRNIAASAPYTNEGIYASLEDIVDHYNRGGQPFRYKDTTLIRELHLEPVERDDLVAFLRSLNDDEFLHNPKFGNPFR